MMAFGVAGLVAASAAGGASAASAGKPSDNANCMGIERATLNSNGGERDHGEFGPKQSAWVQSETVEDAGGYGQWLQTWKADTANGC